MTPTRLLIVTKFRYMGDTIVATPILRALRRSRPDAHVTLLAGPVVPELLRGCPYVDEIWTFEPRAPGRIASNRGLLRRVRGAGFDTALLLNRSLHSALVVWCAGVPIRIGFDTEYRGPLLTVRVPYDSSNPERDCLAELLRPLGIDHGDLGLPELWVTEEERAAAYRLLAEQGLDADPERRAPLVALHPGANDPHVREWGAARFAEVGRRLIAERDARVVVMRGPGEQPAARQVHEAIRSASRRESSVVLSAPLRSALAVLSLCDLWIGNDGGMLHAAVALGPATVGIFGPTKAPRWGYDAPRHRTMVVYPQTPARTPEDIRRCLDAITPDAVFEEASGLLANRAS